MSSAIDTTFKSAGLHHVTLITRKVQPNVDFYAGFLGLKLVKRTAGFEDAQQLHLFYGDAEGRPGSLVSFLVWQDGAPGRVGHGQPLEIAFAIQPEAIGFWLTRALRFQVPVTGPAQEFGEPVLRLKDPDGVIVKLVGTTAIDRQPLASPVRDIPDADAILGLRAATVLSEKPEKTAAFLMRHFGLTETAREGTTTRLAGRDGDAVDVRDAGGFWTSAPGTGTIDHIALRAPDVATLDAVEARLKSADAGATNAHDRTYFHSLYVREPQGTLFELATDGPGMAIDEPEGRLGETLFIPPHAEGKATDLKAVLPQFALPGDPRMTERELPFIHRIVEPETANGRTLVLLHGTGGNETSLLPLGRELDANALMLSLRGRSLDEGFPRFFRRLTAVTFDQKDIAGESAALAAFIEGARDAYGVDLARTVFVGYSNGANILGAMMLAHPGLIRHAVLIRAMNVLETIPAADLSGTSVLMTTGEHDPYGRYAASLETALARAGAKVENRLLSAGHELTMEDVRLARTFIANI
ncbi:phospholipase/carboxylesterase [Rhizobium sp. RU20A]|uniref:VOC family protein n=1 Tax=Rhizobium sp. RU20A TaxID=1907412 RepID=UPI00095446E2|nr:VOC family protein [Rhizobium sp. RU20A]SIQ33584.1 phospholipase/carboxylesterase [Rhizobium sp. RU20A]